MSYRDPYAETGRYQPRQYAAEYNAYSTAPQQAYDDGGIGPGYDAYSGYTDESAPRVVRYAGLPSQNTLTDETNKESGFHHEPYPPTVPKER